MKLNTFAKKSIGFFFVIYCTHTYAGYNVLTALLCFSWAGFYDFPYRDSLYLDEGY